MKTQTYTEVLSPMECCACHITFAVTQSTEARFRETHEWFYCPMGHQQHFSAKSRTETLAADLERARTQTDYWRKEQERTERQRRAAKGEVTKIKRRVGRGVCPCCNRTFPNVTNHMNTEHPDFAEAES